MKLKNFILLALVFFTIESFGGELDRAIELYLDDDFAAAHKIVSAPAFSQSGRAWYLMSMLVLKPGSPFKDPTKVIEYSEKSSRLGFPAAISNLGTAALNGEWGAVDYAKAKVLLEKAAALGDRNAHYGLAYMYEQGLEVELSLPKSMALLARGAELGDAESAYKLGNLLRLYPEHSNGLSQFVLFKRAADLGSASGAFMWARACAEGEQIDRNLDEAYKGFKFAADAGLPLAQVNLGHFYQKGWGTQRNNLLAYKYYWLASGNLQSADYQLKNLTQALSQSERAEAEEKKAQWKEEAQRAKKEIDSVNRRESIMARWRNDGPEVLKPSHE